MPKILVVDDSGTMRKIVIRSVKAAGFEDLEFTEAGDGCEGLEAMDKGDYDLILSDINMPNMDGIEFVKAVRARTETKSSVDGDKEVVTKGGNSTPIIMITTESGLEKVQEALSAGASEYMKKPFTADQIQEKLGPFLS